MKGIRVGIADDCRSYCEILTDYLKEQQGIETAFIAYDGAACVEAVAKERPDVLLLDMTMPQLDGIGVLEHLNEMELEPFPKVLMMSAGSGDFAIRRATDLGADHCIMKPFRFDTLVKRISQIAEDEGPFLGCGEEASRLPHRPLKRTAAEDASGKRGSGNSQAALEEAVTRLFHQIGIPAHVNGYKFLRDSVIYAVNNPDVLCAVTKELYPAVAKMNKTTGSRVERSIRSAIEIAWSRGNTKVQEELFGYTVNSEKGKPTNSEFIAGLADRFRRFDR